MSRALSSLDYICSRLTMTISYFSQQNNMKKVVSSVLHSSHVEYLNHLDFAFLFNLCMLK
jgi:hypothetical protein